MIGFMRRSGLQVLTSLSHIAMLVLFIVAYPRFAEDPSEWAADYFISLAVLTPVFMLFGFELRKRGAAETPEGLEDLNAKRVRGTIYATFISIALFFPAHYFGFLNSAGVFAAILLFRAGSAINDQISANYEALDRFGLSLMSTLAKAVVFVVSSLAVGYLAGPNWGVVAGTLAFVAVWLIEDRKHMIGFMGWGQSKATQIEGNDLITGFGSFLIALTVSLPRLVAAAVFGEQTLNMIGVGQSLSRIGQVLSGSLVQTLIALHKKNIDVKGAETRLTYLAQFASFALMVCLLPLWQFLFPYAVYDNFNWVVSAILFFGLLSQYNFILQSFRLLRSGGRDYIRSPIVFLALFCVPTAIAMLLGWLHVWVLIAIMLIARLAQLVLNYRALQLLQKP